MKPNIVSHAHYDHTNGLATCGIEMLYTGHCTGEQAFNILKSRFGEKIEQFHSGMEIEI